MTDQAHSPFNRRAFLLAGAAAAGSVAVPVPAQMMGGKSAEDMGLSAAPELATAQAGDSVIDQIVRIYGGWKYDQAAAEQALADAKSGSGKPLPPQVLAYRRRSHGIQAAMQAEADGAEAPMIVAALLHDIGHVFSPAAPAGLKNYDDKHELYGVLWLRNVFVPEVSEPVLRHVAAKRWLVTTRQEYWDKLSEGSKASLIQQGGRMSKVELEQFEVLAYAQDGVQLRLWDDRAKVKGLKLEPIEKYLKAMEQCLRKQA